MKSVHLERVDQLVDPLEGPGAVHPVHLDHELEELAAGELVVQIGLVGNIAEELPRLLRRAA